MFSLAALALGLVTARPAAQTATVREGVLRWEDGSEVALFGVNYYPPFAMDFAELKRVGADVRAEIDASTAHFLRLGLTSLRLHVFDREISDEEGNLLDNEHLDALDYLLFRCKERGLYVVLTPIAWWPVGGQTRGFSNRFDMPQMTTDREAWECQRRYLVSFLNHVNRYTNLPYRDDPVIVALEAINEPIYPPGTPDEKVTEWIDYLMAAMRSTGCRKPMFFNCWGGRGRAVAASTADGATNGWYPTGLVAGQALWNNFLPVVAHYDGFRDPALADKPKMIYEFDAADVPMPYMYPAMARAFREAGVQIANQFQYDCLALADTNINWMTHYLNLVYASAKAISFAIAARAFYELPRGASFGDYPQNSRFGDFRVDFEAGLSEMVGNRWFMYSGSTDSTPPAPEQLEHVWGVGSSPVVEYQGTGAYFLDRLSPGVWQLEIYPDTVWVNDPYGAPGATREVSRLIWLRREIVVRLPDLGRDFSVLRLAPERREAVAAREGKFGVEPGVWLLVRKGMTASEPARVEFHCPRPKPEGRPAAWLLAPHLWREGRAARLLAFAALADGEPQAAELWSLSADGEVARHVLARTAPYHFEGTVAPPEKGDRRLRYALALQDARGWYCLPAQQWLSPEEFARTAHERILLWEAGPTDLPAVTIGGEGAGTAQSSLVSTPEGHALRVEATKFGPPPSAAKVSLKPMVPQDTVGTGWALVVEGRATQPQTTAVDVSLVQDDGAAFGGNFPIGPQWSAAKIPLDHLRPMWNTSGVLDLRKLKEITVIFGAWLYGPAANMPHGFEIRCITLEPAWCYEADLLPADAALPVVAVLGLSRPMGGAGSVAATTVIEGSQAGRRAYRLTGGPFEKPPDAVYQRFNVTGLAPGDELAWRNELARCGQIVFTARAGTPNTNAVEIVFVEDDGAPWGLNLPLAQEWRTIIVRTDELKFWGHWWHPENRGGPGDRFHPERLQYVNICFGAWLYPQHREQVHCVDIELIGLEP